MPHTQDILRSKFFNEADILFWLWDKDLNLIDVNEATLKVFKFKRNDIIGKNICEISPDAKSSGRFDQYMNVIRTGKTLMLDEVRSHPSLGNFHFRLKAFKVGEGLGSIITDISDLKEVIEELETFIYKSSHDMRSPITTILGLMNLAETDVKEMKEAKHYFQLVKQQTERLNAISHVLIDAMSIRKDEKTIHCIDFEKLLKDVLISLEHLHGFTDIKFETTVHLTNKFYGDKQLLVSLFQNLIDNAIKYKKDLISDSYIKTNVETYNGGIKISVSDNGMGIPANLQKDVFKMFFRGTTKASGSGLGLYTVSHTVKRMGGTIKLDSTEKIGTTFHVYLPTEKIGN